MSDELKPGMRPVTEEDENLLRRIFFSSWDRAFSQADWSPEMKEAVLNQQFEAQSTAYFTNYPEADHTIILVEDEPVGRLYVRREERIIVLMDITLLPEWRNRGLGSMLVRSLLAEAAASVRAVELHVEKWNPDARHLYLRLGFLDTEDIGSHWKMAWRSAQDIKAS